MEFCELWDDVSINPNHVIMISAMWNGVRVTAVGNIEIEKRANSIEEARAIKLELETRIRRCLYGCERPLPRLTT